MIPEYLRLYESSLKNFSLHFDYFATWDDNLKSKVEHHVKVAGPITRHADETLKKIHVRQSACLGNIQSLGGLCLEITARLQSPYVSGLGGCHPTETGFVLDRNSGLPYIPASAIKGVLRVAHVLDIAERFPGRIKETKNGFEIEDREPTMRKYFGDTDNAVRGQLVFLDAYPATLPTIKQDIMNPHFGPYYKGEAPPRETDSPIPVMFMAVEAGVMFKFRVFALPLAEGASVSREFNGDDRKAILDMFSRAFSQLGFGAKTSIGYGRMDDARDTTHEMQTSWEKVRQEEENRRHPWKSALQELEGVSDWGGFRQKGIECAALIEGRAQREVAQRVFDLACALRKKRKSSWESSRDELIADWLKPTGLSWPPADEAAAPVAGNEAGAELERIKGITKWVDYLAAPAHLGVLSKNGLKTLREKLKGWGCDAKDAKPDKKTMWEELNRKMKNG